MWFYITEIIKTAAIAAIGLILFIIIIGSMGIGGY
jgi:hypothetical protein